MNIPNPNHNSNRSTFREHIRAKNPYQDLINSNNNNNNSSSTNNNLTNNSNINNNDANSTNQNLSPKYAIQQMNSSSKILDNQKYHKYFSKRKMMAQYELEMRNEKKHKVSLPTPPAAHQQREQSEDQPVALYAKSHLPPPQTEPEELTVNETNNNSSATANNNTISSTNNSAEVQIKVEPDIIQRNSSGVIATVAATGVNDDDEEDSSNSEKYFLADLRKRKHSTSAIEQTLALTTKKEASTACS